MPEMPPLEVSDTHRSADHVTRDGTDRNQKRPLSLPDYGQEVMLDSDRAHLYGVATSSLKKQGKRTITRFPDEVAVGSILKR